MTVMTIEGPPENPGLGQDEILRLEGWPGWRSGQGYHSSSADGAAWVPAVEVSERGDAYLVTVEIPGIRPSEVVVTLEDGLLTIHGTRQAAPGVYGEKIHRSERRYGIFHRSVTLPGSHAPADKTEAVARDGVLRILVPKAPRTRVRAGRVQVRVDHGAT